MAKQVVLYSGYDLACKSKDDIRFLTHIITGHSYLKYFQNKIGNDRSLLCDKCGEDIETVAHFLTKCPAFALLRYQIFGAFELRDTNINFLALLSKLLAFGKATRYLDILYGVD